MIDRLKLILQKQTQAIPYARARNESYASSVLCTLVGIIMALFMMLLTLLSIPVAIFLFVLNAIYQTAKFIVSMLLVFAAAFHPLYIASELFVYGLLGGVNRVVHPNRAKQDA